MPNPAPSIAIKTIGLGKYYRLFRSPRERLKEAFHPFGKHYHQKFHALKDINLTIEKGSTIGIVGHNGSGKSTLLQCLCGIVKPTAGGVTTNGRIAALLELGAGFDPQFTGRDNLYINGAILGMSKHEIDQRLEAILAFADIGDFIDQPVRTYSSGMFVRLAFAVAVHVDPQILIVDEALSVGDAHFQAKCYAHIRQLKQQGVTVVFVTHDLNMVTQYCDYAYLLEKGWIVAQGNPNSVIAQYRKIEGGYVPNATDKDNAPGYKETRYGSAQVKIIDGGIFDDQQQRLKTLDSGTHYTISMWLEFYDSITNPVFAFTIKDVRGTEIAGTNSEFENIETGHFSKGQKIRVSFQQKITLNAGSYLLSLGCVNLANSALDIYDRRHDFLSFKVIAKKPLTGVVDLGSTITIEPQ